MELIDNINKTLAQDLKQNIRINSKVSIAASCFSIYAYQELKEQLENIEELRFIFTSPTFNTEKAKKEKREFYIPKLNRERSLYGTEFEIKLRNELSQKAIAKECAEWIKNKVTFKTNTTNENMVGFINVDDKNYMPINGFTTVDLGCERGNNAYNMVQKTEAPISTEYLKLFNNLWNDKEKLEDVTDIVIDNITNAYNENAPEYLYFVTLYNIFSEFLEDISEDILPKEATGFKKSAIWSKLYNFQQDACLAIINKLEKYNGCILADSVGLGKTFTALSVIKYYESRNSRVLVLCPKKLANNWNIYKNNYKNNPIADDRLRYDVLFHTDLNRTHGQSNGNDLAFINWGNYDLVVIDESHNFRNGYGTHANTNENRYMQLMEKVIKQGVKTKVLMLSATPVNNRFLDLKNQLALAYEGVSENLDERLDTKSSIDDIFTQAQRAFTRWSKLPSKSRTTENLLNQLSFDFFEVLDSVTIARSRKHIQKYYDTKDIGTFPTRLHPISIQTPLTDSESDVTFNIIFEELNRLKLTVYVPSLFIFPSKRAKYELNLDDETGAGGFDQMGRELGIRRLMAINLLKRLESSVYSFRLTLQRVKYYINQTIKIVNEFDLNKNSLNTSINLTDLSSYDDDIDDDDQNAADMFTIGKKVKIDLNDMDYKTWLKDLEYDVGVLSGLEDLISDITPEKDSKLNKLLEIISNKIEHPINGENKKVIVFTAFADTADYLYDNVSKFALEKFSLNSAKVSGTSEGKSTLDKFRCDLNAVLTYFSPISKDKNVIYPNDNRSIDILIATDCLAWHEVEIGDDEYDDMEGEIVDEEDMFGYRAICPKNFNSTTVTILFYYYAPTSEWYWDWMYGLDYKPVIPVVYAVDSNWNLTQCLNSSLSEISLTGQSNGWKSFNITLTRKLMEGERIFFGLYSDLFGYTATGEIENAQTTMCYFYWTRARRNNYASQIAYLSSPDFLSQQRNIFSDYEICIYLQYENEPDSIAYTRTVLGNIGVVTANSRRLNWKRTISGLWNLSSRHSRKTVWKRNSASNGFLSAGAFRSNHLFRATNDSKSFSDFSAKNLFFYRKLEDLKNITALDYRSNRMNIEKSDGFSFLDSLQQLLLIIRSVFSSSDGLDNFSHKTNYKRMPESIIDDIEIYEKFKTFEKNLNEDALKFEA